MKALAAALFDASRQWSVTFHFNKGQAGAATDAVRRGQETSINPAVYDAAALMIIAANGNGYPGVSGHEPDLREAQAARGRVSAAMQIIRELTPDAGAHVNEADYFEPAGANTTTSSCRSSASMIRTTCSCAITASAASSG